MSNCEHSIVPKSERPSRLSWRFVLVLLAVASMCGFALAQNDSWRRTAVGWEQAASWNKMPQPPIGPLRSLTVGTLVQRTWPATIALAEMFLILAVLLPPAKQTD